MSYARPAGPALSPWATTAEVDAETSLLSTMGWTLEEMLADASPSSPVRPGDVLGSGTYGNGGCLTGSAASARCGDGTGSAVGISV